MPPKVIPFDKSVLDEYLNNPACSEYIKKMADLYRNIRDHLKTCEKIAEDVFGAEQCPEYIMAVHGVSLDFMLEGSEDSPGIEFIPDERLVSSEEDV